MREDRRAQREGEVLAHRHVRIERILLEDHRDVALRRGEAGHRAAADQDLAAVGAVEAGDQAQRRGLAGAGRAEQDDEGAVRDGHRHVVEGGVGAEGLGDVGEDDLSHGEHPLVGGGARAPGPRSASKTVSVRASKSRPMVSPTRDRRRSEATRALTAPWAVSSVTIWVVPRYSVARDPAAVGGGVVEADVLGPDAEDERAAGALAQVRDGDLGVADADAGGAGRDVAVEAEEVHRRRADEVGDEHGRGPVVDLLRLAELLDDAVVHHDDLVAHLHRLELVVGDVDGGRAHAVVEGAQLLGHVLAELGVERAERLVHQEGLGLAHDGAAEGDALAVAAGEAADRAVEDGVDAEDARDLRDLGADLGAAACPG